MIIWLDAQLSPAMASWITREFSVEAVAVRDVGLLNAKDPEIFHAARQADAIVMTKDADFVRLVAQAGPPPHVILIACGNTSNSQLKQILKRTLDQSLEWIRKGEPVVEITSL